MLKLNYYTPEGFFVYRIIIHGTEYVSIKIEPPAGKSFDNQQVELTLEALKTKKRRFGKTSKEDVAVLRVACSDLSFEEVAQQDILWNWKHEQGSVTPADSANARAFAYVGFSAFVAGMKKITIGGADESQSKRFAGRIDQVEVADQLPADGSVFWSHRQVAISQDEKFNLTSNPQPFNQTSVVFESGQSFFSVGQNPV